MKKFGLIRNSDNSTKYSVYLLHENGSPKDLVYRNVTYAEGLRIIRTFEEWQPDIGIKGSISE